MPAAANASGGCLGIYQIDSGGAVSVSLSADASAMPYDLSCFN